MNLQNVECLDLDNYSVWSEKVRFILDHQRLLKFIEEDDRFIKQLVKTKAGEDGEKAARLIISSTVDEEIYGEIIGKCKSAKEMWLTLQSVQMDFESSIVFKDKFTEPRGETCCDNLSCYDEALYFQPPDQMKAQLYQLRVRMKRLRQNIMENRDRCEKMKPRCRFCKSKIHTSDKCWQLKNIKLSSSAHLCSLM